MPDPATDAPLLEPAFLHRLERLALAVRKVQLGMAKGERKSKRKGASMEFADYRDYVQGDDLRHVDWNIYGRLDALYLKLFEEQEDLSVHLLIDASRSMAFGTPHKFDFARRLAAAIGYIGLVGYDRVSLASLEGEVSRCTEPLRGKASARRLFSAIEGMRAESATSLQAACRHYLLRRRGRGVVLLLSDLMDEGGFEEGLKQLAGAGADVYVIQVLAPEELDPRLTGDLNLVDSETKAMAEISVSRALLKRYARNRDAFLESARQYCLARGMAHFAVSSGTPVERLTLDILRKGGLVR